MFEKMQAENFLERGKERQREAKPTEVRGFSTS
jgi:hypothetical protein